MANLGEWTDPKRWSRVMNRSRRRDRNATWWRVGIAGAAGAAGAIVMFIFDPQAGRRRRHVAYDRSAAAVRRTARRTERLGRRAGAEVSGQIQRLRHLRPAQRQAPNDEALADRVRSTILRAASVPAGRINVNAQHGVVVLRGQLDRLDQIRSLTEAAMKVPGVRDVVSYLHLPQTPAPNKEEAIAGGHHDELPTPASGSESAEQPAS